MKRITKTPLAVTLGTTLLSALASANVHAGAAFGTENPFALRELAGGYMQTAAAETESAEEKKAKQDMKQMQGACGEGKCGASMMQNGGKTNDAEKQQQSSDSKAIEAKCAGMKK
ncbi:MAG: hypothetical protein ACU837_01920 [Gammaproteobacteria bacterium]